MNHEKITATQIFSILILSRLGSLFFYTSPPSELSRPTEMLVSVVIGFVVQMLMILPVLFLYRKYDGESIVALSYKKLGRFGIIPLLIFGLYCFFITAQSVVEMASFLSNSIVAITIWFFIITILLAAIYIAYQGINVITRPGLIVFIFSFVSILIIIIGVVQNYNPLFISYQFEIEEELVEGVFEYLIRNSEVFLLVMLLPLLKEKRGRLASASIGASALLTIGALFMITTMLGSYAEHVQYPSFSAISAINIFEFRRYDTIHVCFMVLYTLFRCSIFFWAGMNCFFQKVAQKQSKKQVLLCAAVVGIIAYFLGSNVQLIEWIQYNAISVIIIVALVCVFPLILLLIKRKERKQNGAEQTESH